MKRKKLDTDYIVLISIIIILSIILIVIILNQNVGSMNLGNGNNTGADNNIQSGSNTEESNNTQSEQKGQTIDKNVNTENFLNESSSSVNSNSSSGSSYSCPSGYTMDNDGKSCYKITTMESLQVKACPSGYSLYVTDNLEEKCRKYVINDDVMIYSNPYCVSGGNVHQELSLQDNACLDPKNRTNRTEEECKSLGFFWSTEKNYCYYHKSNILYMISCPDGYSMSDSEHCYKYDIVDRIIKSANCPSGYNLSEDKTSCTYKETINAIKR